MEQTTNNPENDILVMDVYLIITDGKVVADVRFHLTGAVNELEELRETANQDISDFAVCFQSMNFCDPKDIKTIVYHTVSQMPKDQYVYFESHYTKQGLTKLTHGNQS